MPEANYDNLKSEIKALNLSDQLRLLGDMATMIRQKTGNVGHRSIMELKGKGKEIWKAVDVKKYLDEERSSWNG